MGQLTYGVIEARVGDFDPLTGEITNTKVIALYKDTFSMEDDTPTTNKFYQQGKKSPRLIRTITADDVVNFSLMETDAESMAFAFGGTVTALDGRKRWNKPKGFTGEIIRGLEFDTEDGSLLRIPRGSWVARKSFVAADANINLIPVSVTATDTGLPAVADMTWDDPEEEVVDPG